MNLLYMRPNILHKVSFSGTSYGKFSQQNIGNTSLIDMSHLSQNQNVNILAKCEFQNPSMSIKDRIVEHIINKAEIEGKLLPRGTIIAASSGNTGASVAMHAAMRGYHCKIYTNTQTSKEKCDAITAYGAELEISPDGVPHDSPVHYMNAATIAAEENPTYFNVDQYSNMNNPDAYYCTLGPEIWKQTKGTITHFVAGASTGGTISGTMKYLKEQNCKVQGILADPIGSVFYEYFKTGTHGKVKKFLVEGVGKDSVPKVLDISLVNNVIQIPDQDTFDMCRNVSKSEGFLMGGSSGLNLAASVALSGTIDNGVIVTVLCDSGIKYLSKIYNDDYLKENNITVQ